VKFLNSKISKKNQHPSTIPNGNPISQIITRSLTIIFHSLIPPKKMKEIGKKKNHFLKKTCSKNNWENFLLFHKTISYSFSYFSVHLGKEEK
jgi:hypothetical protein